MKYPSSVVSEARELREKQLSLYEISKLLNVPSSSVRNWCIDLRIDRKQSLITNNKLRREKTKRLDLNLVPEQKAISSDMAKFLAALLYGCEGAKYPATNIIAFVNSDPSLVKTFLFLLRKGFKLDENKLRVQLQIHNTHTYSKLIKYWSRLLEIPTGKFLKPTVTQPRGKMKRQNYPGTCSLRYIDNKIQLRLLGIFEGFCSQGGVA